MNVWNKYIGKPFKDNARGPNYFDCYGLLYAIYKDILNIKLPLFNDEYFTTTNKIAIKELIERETSGDWQKITAYMPLDIVIFRFLGWPLHVGIIMDENRFIHALRGSDVCVEHLNNPLWRKKIDGFYRYNPNRS